MQWINKKHVWGLIIGFVLIMLALFIAPGLYVDHSPQRKPETEKGKWYVVFFAKEQKITAYTAYSSAAKGASGKDVILGSAAVHPRVPVNQGGNVFEPVIPFDTRLFFSEPVNIQGNSYDTFTVLDTGDINYRLWGESPYWIDVYWGIANNYTLEEARDFGVDSVDYFWIEEWR